MIPEKSQSKAKTKAKGTTKDRSNCKKAYLSASIDQYKKPAHLTFINEMELANIIGKKPSTVRYQRIEGKGCNFYKIEGSIHYRLSEVMEYIKACKTSSTAKKL